MVRKWYVEGREVGSPDGVYVDPWEAMHVAHVVTMLAVVEMLSVIA